MEFLSYLISGISLGSVYAIIALGYTMVYGIAKMLNFAHGDVIMVGGYVSLMAVSSWGLPAWAAVLVAMVVCTVLGVIIEGLAYKPLRAATSLAVLITAIGVSYFLVRILGKYAGAWLGCRLVKKDKLVRNYLGLALIPQAGVAIGLAALGARTLGGTMGSDLQTIILASSVLYELIGPACAKLSLYLSHSYSNKLEDITPEPEPDETGCPKSEVERLIERINAIQSELPAHRAVYYEDEKAFSDAAEEHYAALYRALPAERRKR